MENLITSFEAVLPLFLMIMLGMFLRRIGMLEEKVRLSLNKLCFKVFLPIYLFNNIYSIEDISKAFDLRLILFACDDVHQPVHTVTQIDVQRPRLCIHDLCTLCSAFMGMAGGILFAAIGLRLRNTQTKLFPDYTVYEDLPNQITGNRQTRSVVKCRIQSAHPNHLLYHKHSIAQILCQGIIFSLYIRQQICYNIKKYIGGFL